MKIDIHEVKSQISRLAELAWPRLAPRRAGMAERKPGGLEGQIWMSDDFDEEDEELIAEIENSKIFPDED